MTEDGLKGALAQIVAPLVEADEGELYLVKEEGKSSTFTSVEDLRAARATNWSEGRFWNLS